MSNELKEIDWATVQINGVDGHDAPDFSDAYFEKGYFADGSEMTEDDLCQAEVEFYEKLREMAEESFR